MVKYFDKELEVLRENFWGYRYRIIYWSDDGQERRACTGIVLAVSTEAAIDQIKECYLDEKDLLIEIHVAEMEDGELGKNLILELTSERMY